MATTVLSGRAVLQSIEINQNGGHLVMMRSDDSGAPIGSNIELMTIPWGPAETAAVLTKIPQLVIGNVFTVSLATFP